MIFDCCHSASGSRSDNVDKSGVSRTYKIKTVPPSNLDSDIWQKGASRGASIAPGFAQTGLRSHVLLSGCGAKEESKERDGRGDFTKGLVETLRRIGADNLSYAAILKHMPELPEYVLSFISEDAFLEMRIDKILSAKVLIKAALSSA